MKSKGKIKLSDKERNQVDLICELPATVQQGKYLVKYIKGNYFKIIYAYIYIHMYYSYTSYKKTELVWVEKTLPLSKISTTNCFISSSLE